MTGDSGAPSSAPESSWRTAWQGWPGRVFRLVLALLPLAWLFHWIDPDAVLSSAAHVGATSLLAALSVQILSQVFVAARWRALLASYGADPARLPPLGVLMRHVFVGLYFSVLPSGIVGDAMRAQRVSHCLPSVAISYVVVFVERLAALVGLLVVAAVTASFAPEMFGGPVARALSIGLVLSSALALVGFALPQATRRIPSLATTLERIPLVGRTLARIPPAENLAGPIWAVVHSIATQILVIVTVALLLRRLDVNASFATCARVVPAIVLVTSIPLTPGGVGQREIAFVEFFRPTGVAPAHALAASLLTFALVIALALLGGVVLLVERRRAFRA